MKRCPQCNSVFNDTQDFCTSDGSTLVEEHFVLPSEASPADTEEETVVHHEPIRIEIPNTALPAETPENQLPPTARVVPVIIEKKRSPVNYFFVLMIGLILGGALVLGILALLLFQNRNSTSERPVENVQISSGKHTERNTTRKDAEFNGFVLSESANLRSAPGSAVLDSLPKNDRLEILERDDAWYRVVCEHGVAGWMHGNTIRFNDDAEPF
jgi:hypothetical protein